MSHASRSAPQILTPDPANRHDAVVLGGGGLSAIGRSIGVLAALEEHDALRLADQDVIIGTSAGAAVPGLWPSVGIGGDYYVDGGTFSLTNAELAASSDRVLILQPIPENPAYQRTERAAMFSRAVVVEPSERARAGFGPNPFDPDVRGVVAVLGYQDSLAVLGERKEVW